MRQKVAIGCGYLHDPKAILLDEPLTGLDPRAIRTMKETIQTRAAAGAAVMVSSHLLSLVEDICTSVLMFHRGQVILSGRLDDLAAQGHGRRQGGVAGRPVPAVDRVGREAARRPGGGLTLDASLVLLLRLRFWGAVRKVGRKLGHGAGAAAHARRRARSSR